MLGKTVKVIFIAFFLFLVSLCFRQQRLPRALVDKLCEKCSSGDFVVSCDSASFGFRQGVFVRGVRVFDRRRSVVLKPAVSVDTVSVRPFLRLVTAVGLRVPSLDGGGSGDGASASRNKGDAFTGVRLPRIPRFSLELIRPDILGVAPESVECHVVPERGKVVFSAIRIVWPDQDHRMWLDGSCTLDFAGGLIAGEVRGTARQEHIRPLLTALDISCAYPYMGGYPDTGTSGFTEVQGPVPVACAWRYDFAARDFRLDLDLHPQMGRYNDVRLQRVDGQLGVHAYFADDDFRYDVRVGPLVASDPHGRRLEGELTVHGTNGLAYLDFDAASDLEKQHTLDIIGYLNRGTFDAITCETPPRVTAKGVFNCDEVNIAANDFSGRFELAAGEIFGQRFTDAEMDYRLKGSGIVLTNLTAKGSSGGDVSAWMRFHLPIADDDASGFYGEGRIDTRDGKVAQVPLFLALTEALADNVPGIDKIVTQSDSICEFTLSNGVFRTDRLIVQGALFCYKISGSYDFENDALDMVAHCTIMKEDSILGKYLIQPVLWPFTKLLTEFHVSGTRDEPVIRNKTVKSISDITGGIIKKVFD